MKKILVTLSLTIASLSFAQTLETVKRTAPVFPGCENTKENIQKCFNDKFNDEVNLALKNVNPKLDSLSIDAATAKVKVNIRKDGTFGNTNILQSSNKEFTSFLKQAITSVTQKIGKVSPAKDESGEASEIMLVLPVKYTRTE